MNAYELYRDAKLGEAIEAALHQVKTAPTDIDARLLLCDLLCLDNQLARADRQLDVMIQQDSTLAAGLGIYRQLVRAELARNEVFQSGRAPEVMDEMTEVLALHLRASMALREGQVSEAGELLRDADERRQPINGTCDGQPFSDIRDLNDLTASFLEVLTTTGKYYWVPWERVETLEFRPPKYLRDLLWRQAAMTVRNGPEAVVYVPVLYAGSSRSDDVALRLGRSTAWVETPGGPTAGVGQRTLLVGDADTPILSISSISCGLNP